MELRRFVVVSDNHGDMIDLAAERAFFEFVKYFKPTVRIHAGDNFDFRSLRRKASDMEQRDGLGADIDAGLAFLRKFKPTHFLRGNHDERLWKLLKGDDRKMGDLARTVADDIVDALGDAKMLPYHKRKGVLKLGDTKIIHGFKHGVTATRMTAMIFGKMMMGHIHAVDYVSISRDEPCSGRAIGCLCQLDMEFNETQLETLRHAHGWAYGFASSTGVTQTYQAEKIGGVWHLPTEFRSLKDAS